MNDYDSFVCVLVHLHYLHGINFHHSKTNYISYHAVSFLALDNLVIIIQIARKGRTRQRDMNMTINIPRMMSEDMSLMKLLSME